jgi:hypothetical protein
LARAGTLADAGEALLRLVEAISEAVHSEKAKGVMTKEFLQPRRILFLTNLDSGKHLPTLLEGFDHERGTEVLTGGGSTLLDSAEEFATYATKRPDVVLMHYADRSHGIGDPSIEWWLASLLRYPQLADLPRVLIHSGKEEVDHSQFFKVLPATCTNRAILLAIREALLISERKTLRLFISYSRKDGRFVRRLAADLSERQYSIWLDEAELRVGDSLTGRLRIALDAVDYVIAVISPHSVQSEWVRKELEIAMNNEIERRRIIVLPLLRRHCDLPGFLKGKVYADFTPPRAYGAALNAFTTQLAKLQDDRSQAIAVASAKSRSGNQS